MSQFILDPFIDMPDDDDMPPLVDRPLPPLMTAMPMITSSYSFDADFATIPYSPYSSLGPADMVTEPTPRFELISEEDAPRISATATDGATAPAATKPSHAKKRDAGHIPRPPNAFILFRSSFIKSESVPGNIEGNHSTLSKIIGIVWKTLPPAEREMWEKRAMQAQVEHRARYPDWRFRPGTNVDAIAKRKTKDKNKDRPPPRRRRNTRDKSISNVASAAPTGGGGNDGDGNWGGGPVGRGSGGGRCKGKARGIIQERRCAQIAELLTRGVKGVALSSAVQAWDKESGVSKVTDGVFVSEQGVQGLGADTDAGADSNPDADASRGRKEMRAAKNSAEVELEKETIKVTKTRSSSSAQQPRFNFPHTSMFRRASSAPLVPENGAAAQGAAVISTPTMTTNFSPDLYPPPLSPASSVSYGSEVSFPDSDNMSAVPPMFDFVPFSPPGSPCSSNMDNNDIGALGSVNPNANATHCLGVSIGLGPGQGHGHGQGPGQGQAPESASSMQSFFFSDYSSYSSLCDWASGTGTTGPGIIDNTHHNHHTPHHYHHANNAKVVLPPPYGCFGENESETDHPFSFLPTATAAVMDPWNNVQDLVVARPLLDGLEDPMWSGGARVAAPYA